MIVWGVEEVTVSPARYGFAASGTAGLLQLLSLSGYTLKEEAQCERDPSNSLGGSPTG